MTKQKKVEEAPVVEAAPEIDTVTPPEKKREKYVATFEHSCDDFSITTDDGREVFPHFGEMVTFRRDMPWEMMSINMDMDNLAYMTAVLNILIRQVRGWTWTDDDEVLRPDPLKDPDEFLIALIDLTSEEREYLRANCWQRANLGEESGSGS